MLSRQLPLDLGEAPASPPLPWEHIPSERQLAVLAALARLIAQAVVQEEAPADAAAAAIAVA